MLINLNNSYLKVSINTKGAELNSIKSNNTEYLWQANAKYWPRHAPILFPIVGRLRDNHYQIDQKKYRMTQHGFARDLEFDVIKHSSSIATFKLTDNPQTRKIYPFHFELIAIYKLNQHSINAQLIVKNIDDHQILFSIGAHPGFNIPIQNNTSTFNDYSIKVAPSRVYNRIKLHHSYSDTKNTMDENLTRPIALKHTLFKNDAIILDTHNHETTVMLSNDIDQSGVAINSNCPYLGIWSTKDAPFVCIEPWWGIADDIHHNGNFKNKVGINKLLPSHKFNAKLNITVF